MAAQPTKDSVDVDIVGDTNTNNNNAGHTAGADNTISIDSSQIPVVPLENQFSGSILENLSKLGVQTYNPDEVEKSILNQIDVAMAKEDEVARHKLAAIKKEIVEIQRVVKNTVIPDLPPNASQDDREVVEGMQLARGLKLRKLDDLQKQEAKLAREIRNRRATQKSQNGKAALNFGLEEETENDRLIRTGKLTPFEVSLNENKEKTKQTEKTKQIEKTPTVSKTKTTIPPPPSPSTTPTSRTTSSSTHTPRTSSTTPTTTTTSTTQVYQPPQRRAAMKRKVNMEEDASDREEDDSSDESYMAKPRKRLRKRKATKKDSEEEKEDTGEEQRTSDEEYKIPLGIGMPQSSSEESDEVYDEEILGSVGEDEDEPVAKKKFKMEGESWVDDGNEKLFQKRLAEFMRIRWLNKIEKKKANGEEVPENIEDAEIEDEDTTDEDDIQFGGGMKVPQEMYENLFEYQKTGVRWMWELHCQNAGGIIGDEMGLGKTVQTICFLGSLHHSKLLDGPCIVICPATLMTQWVREFHTWWPPFRVALLHGSGTHIGPRADIINAIAKKGHILITTYEGIRINQEQLLKHRWEYLVMDEGHKIRNPDAEITITCKKFPTTHRLILTGAPIQNNLTELWSLFDFVFPGRLGTLPIFQAQFEVPISAGGYANASPVQVQTAYKCAVALRDLINPYMLRRMKADVLKSLPKKTEQVLFCQLTEAQSEEYRNFLKSQEVQQVLDGKRHLLYAIDWMRKICNHPDLLHRESSERPGDYGNWERSGKLRVVEQILPMWKQQGHKVLLFCQTRQMLDIVESFVRARDYHFLRLDGMTAIKQRMALVDTFNNDPSISKVGGLGINLVGADRVLLFDPDWNPSTDVQARERVWRIGQKRDVTIYRLITSGTIEEKIYHRQIFKEFLTNKILKDPRQKRFFKSKNLHDLFTLGDYHKRSETSDIFAGLNPDVQPDEHEHEEDEEGERREERGREAVKKEESDGEDAVEKSRNRKKAKDDMKILRALFNGEGLKGAVKHDAIVDQSNPEHIIVEYEANRIAEKAVEALRRSRQYIQRQRTDPGTPTWTGRSGQAGAPLQRTSSTTAATPKPRFGSQSSNLLATLSSPSPSKPPSSSSILSSATAIPSSNVVRNFGMKGKEALKDSVREKVAEREKAAMGEVGFANAAAAPMSSQDLLQKLRQGGGTAGRKTTFGDGTTVNVTGGVMDQTLSDVLDFLLSLGGSATTQAIVDKFKFSTSPQDAPVFRGMLRRIATFDQQMKAWEVKPEWVVREEA